MRTGLRGSLAALGLAAWAFGPGAAAEVAGDPAAGAAVFRACKGCHIVGDDARNRVGPVLNGVIGAPAGQIEGFRYSGALRDAANDGLRWTPEALDAFLADPRGVVPGTRMSFRGLPDPRDRADVIAYLATFSDGGAAAPVEAGFTVPDAVLAIEGDPEYGEYLASACTSCHQESGGSDGIPAITGWRTEDFVTALHAYRAKHRDNQVMQLVASRLSDDEIAALAAYFKSLGD